MKKKKLNLQNLEVQSFVTSVDTNEVKGGGYTAVPCFDVAISGSVCNVGTFHVCNVPSEPVYKCNIPSFNAPCTTPVGACIATDTCAVA